MIAIIWIPLHHHLATPANIVTQFILAAGYIPLCRELYYAETNTEDFPLWFGTLIKAGIAFSLAASHSNSLGMVYSIRLAVCTSVVLTLMTAKKWKTWKIRRLAAAKTVKVAA